MINALTIDVEDYFNVTAFEGCIRPEDWDNYPLRVGDNVLKILDILDEFSVRATFFVLGWIAERQPSIVKEIKKRGHEVGSHGYWHRLIYRTGQEAFRQDISKAKELLEDITGQPVIGYRAPSYSIVKESLWALDILAGEGYLYDSSIFPVVHDIYGLPGANRFPHEIHTRCGTIKEFPISTLSIPKLRFSIPVAGGGYLRFLPVCAIKKAITHINMREGQSAVIYFHPWEIDPGQPRIKAPLKSRFRHYTNLGSTVAKIRCLLSAFSFRPMSEILKF